MAEKKERTSMFHLIVITIQIGIWAIPLTAQHQSVLADSFLKIKNYDKAIELYNHSFYEAIEKNKYELGQVEFLNMMRAFYRARLYENAIDSLNYWIPRFTREPNADKYSIAKCYLWQGMVYNRLEQYNNSLNVYEKAIDIFKSENIIASHVSLTYLYAAQVYVRLLNYDKAMDYLDNAIINDTTNSYKAVTYSQIANVYSYKEDYDQVIKYCSLGFENTSNPARIATLEGMAGNAYIYKEDYKKAKRLINKSLAYFSGIPMEWDSRTRLYNSLANIAIQENKNKEANRYFELALNEVNINANEISRESAKLNCAIAKFHFDQKEYDKAIQHCQQALIQVFPNFNSTDIKHNPSIDDIYTESWIMTASVQKGEALRARYEINKDINDMKNASECFDLSLTGIKMLTDSYGSDKAKLYLGDYSHNYFEEAIEINYLLFKATDDQQYLEKMWSIMERSKANVLTEAIQKNRGLILSNIPDSLLEIEQNLRAELVDLNKRTKMEELYEEEADEEYLSELRSRKASRQQEYENILQLLKTNYPSFKSYIEEPITPTLTEVQTYLSGKDETLLEYFEGKDNIYILRIDSEKTDVQQIRRDSFGMAKSKIF